MNNVFFTSDTHFYHRNILKFCPETRYGKDHFDMTEIMVQNWNDRVKPGDDIYHLGDFSFGSVEKTIEIVGRLHGNIHLILGNHDNRHVLKRGSFPNIVSVDVYKELKIDNTKICLFHYPIFEWNAMHYGAWSLHGHTHGSVQIEGKSLDVGIDGPVNRGKMVPAAFEEVREWMKNRTIRSHHNKYNNG